MSRRWVRWTVYLLIAALFAVACVFLSRWQFDRNDEKAEQIALIQQNYDADPVPLSDSLTSGGDLDPASEWHPVALHGEYLADQQLLVRNRPHDGTVAFEVLVPFKNEDGRIVIVDRGWVPPAENSEPSAVPAPPEGEVDVVVRMRPGELDVRDGRSAPPGQVPTIYLPGIANTLDLDHALQSGYGWMVSESPSASALGTFDRPEQDPGPHLSYAIQWILFAVMGFAFIGYVIRTETIKAKEEAGERAPRPPRRRRDRDADDEDALIDAAG